MGVGISVIAIELCPSRSFTTLGCIPYLSIRVARVCRRSCKCTLDSPRDWAKRAGLPNLVNPETGRVRGISPHRLGDAFSVNAMKLGDSGDALRLLQKHLGHASFNTTAKYPKIGGEEHRRWYERLWSKATQ